MKMKLDTKTASNKCKNPESTLLHFLGGCPKSVMFKFVNEYKKDFMNRTKKIARMFYRTFHAKEWYLLSITSKGYKTEISSN